MILARLFRNVSKQNWFTVSLELLVVVVGIFLGIQATNWNEDRVSRTDGYYYLDLLRGQLDAEIQEREEDIAQLSDRINRIRNTYELLYADKWSDDDYAEFKSDHAAVYPGLNETSRPSALRQLLDAGKIDLVESPAIQQMLFSLDGAYEDAITQSQISQRRISDAVTVLTRAIPYRDGVDVNAIPVEPDVLIESQDLKWAVRMILIMNGIQQRSLESLQSARKEARGELMEFLSSKESWIPYRED